MALVFQPLQPTDYESAVELIIRAFGESWRETTVDEFDIVRSDAYYRPKFFGAFENGTLVGVIATMRTGFMTNSRSISWVCVEPVKQKQGIGRFLMRNLIDTVKAEFTNGKGTFLLSAETKNVEYYKNLGFIGDTPTHSSTLLTFTTA